MAGGGTGVETGETGSVHDQGAETHQQLLEKISLRFKFDYQGELQLKNVYL